MSNLNIVNSVGDYLCNYCYNSMIIYKKNKKKYNCKYFWRTINSKNNKNEWKRKGFISCNCPKYTGDNSVVWWSR